MPRPSKTVNSLRGHRTKAEIEARENAEKALKTGQKMKEFPEVKKDDVAHKQFRRLRPLMKANDKDDDLYSAVVNRYCQLYSECKAYETLKETYDALISELSADKQAVVKDFAPEGDDGDRITLAQYYRLKATFSKTIISLDEAIMRKRKMMFDIEKENLMTVASGLRSIPKTPQEKEESPLVALLGLNEN